MAAPIPLRSDYNGNDLRYFAKRTDDVTQARRLLSLAVIYDGERRTDAAKIGGVTLQIIRDWVLRFNSEGPDGLKDKWSGGPVPLLNQEQRIALADIVEKGPTPAIHTVVRWRLCDLAQWIWEEYRISISTSSLGRILNEMGYRKLSARPCHRQRNEEANEAFKKTVAPKWQKSSKKKHKVKP